MSVRALEQSENSSVLEERMAVEVPNFCNNEAGAGSSNTSLNFCQLNLEDLRKDLQFFQQKEDISNGVSIFHIIFHAVIFY